MRYLFVLAVILSAAASRADEASARQHYEAGAVLYEATRYEAALHEFEAAQATEPRPALVYNIARCLDRLGRRQEATAAYKRFLHDDDAIDDAHAEEARARLSAMRPATSAPGVSLSPTVSTVAALPPPPTRRRSYLGPGLLGGGALALAAVGAGLTGSALTSYGQLSKTCAPDCSPTSWQSLPAREHAGEALLGVAGAMAIADIAWFIIVARRK